VIAWLESITRLDSSHNFWWLGLDSSHVEKNGNSNRLESRFSQNDSTRLESQSMTRDSSQSYFYKIYEFLMDKPTSFARKKMSNFCFSDDQDWRKLSVLPAWSCYADFKRSSDTNLHRERPEALLSLRSEQNTIYWQTPYGGLMHYLLIVIVAVGLIQWPWVFSRYQ